MLHSDGRAVCVARAKWLCLILVLWAPLVSCANDEPGAGPSDFELTLVVQDSDGVRARDFSVGERIVLVLTIRNRADATRTLSLSSAMTCDFSIAAPRGGELWRWSHGRRFAQVLTDLYFGPGESKHFSAEWDALAPNGAPATVGSYQASANVAALEPAIASASASFTLR